MLDSRPDGERALPSELRGFGWAAFLWGGVWAVAHRVWIGLFAFVPIFGLIMNVVLGVRGAEWAFGKGSIPDLARYRRAQRIWVMVWGALFLLAFPGFGALSALAIVGVEKYVASSKEAEARNWLATMAKGMANCGAQGEVPQTSQWIPANLSAVSGIPYQSTASDWSSQAAFSCSGFGLSAPQHFRYRWQQATTTSGRFEAEADLNGDGVVDLALQQAVHCAAGACEIDSSARR